MSGPDDGWLSPLQRKAQKDDIDTVIATVRAMRSPAGDNRSARAAVNISEIIEFAAEVRPPGDVARIAREFSDDDDTGYLARDALDAAAARRTVGDLAEIVRLVARHAGPGRVGWLLDAVVTRRMPREIAALLVSLGNGRPELTASQDMLLSRLSDEQTQGDCRVMVVLWLRAHDEDVLASQVSRRLAGERLLPEELAMLIRGLLAQRDAESADAAISGAFRREPDDIAAMIGKLREEGSGHADYVMRAVLSQLAPDKLLLLASLLNDAIWTEGARQIWDAVIPGMPARELAGVLTAIACQSGDHATATGPLRRAALAYPTGQVAALAIGVDQQIERGVATILNTVATGRSVDEIFAVARELSDKGWDPIARRLLDFAAQSVHRRDDGGEVAQFLHRWLGQDGAAAWPPGSRLQRRERVGAVLDRVAERRNPDQLMDMIEGLTRHVKADGGNEYHDHKKRLEAAVGKHYHAAELIRLPRIRGLDHLPAVLDIERAALKRRRAVPPGQVPDLVTALRDSGASDLQLRRLLSDACAKSPDSREIGQALHDRGMLEEAAWVWSSGYLSPF